MASQWFVRSNGKVYGPLDSSKLRQLASSGRIDHQTEVGSTATGPWHPASKVRGLFGSALTGSALPAAPTPASVSPAAAPQATLPQHKSAKKRRGSYVDANLLPGEEVAYRGHLHWSFFLRPVLLLGFAYAMISIGRQMNASGPDEGMALFIVGGIAVLLGIGSLLQRLLVYLTSEFAVTNKRVIMKQGFIRRKTLELMLGKVDSLAVTQGILGRLLGFGTLRVTVATEKQTFSFLANPTEFRKQVQARMPS